MRQVRIRITINSRIYAGWIAALAGLAFIAPVSVFSDVVHLKNGRKLEGVILEESEQGIVLDIGMGSTTIAASRVDRIERSASADNEQTRKVWRTTYISPRDLPEELRPIMTRFTHLQGMRERALQSARGMPVAIRSLESTRKKLAADQGHYRKVSAQLATMSVDDDVDSYNRTVEKNNRMVAEVNKHQARMAKLQDEIERMEDSISNYSSESTLFEQEAVPVMAPYLDGSGDEVAQAWVSRTSKAFDSFGSDFSKLTIPIVEVNGGTIVQVQINGADPVPFILDTGASAVTISETLARQLKIFYDLKNGSDVRLADGSTAKAFPVTLRSVQVGDATANDVMAFVLKRSPGPGVQGLLGMTFLKRFEVQFDSNSSKLVLKKLNPGK
jgi:clan AA aspartic protease (TIGR02281 family)